MDKTCFFISPIGDEGSPERKNSDTVLKHLLEPVCSENGYKIVRADQESSIEKIDQSVIKHLKNDDLVICDLTGNNPNVFYEFGYRQALGLPLIPIILAGQRIPMDVSSLRTISYVTNDLDKVDEIRTKISESIKTLSVNIPAKSLTESNPSKDFNIGQSLLAIQDKLEDMSSMIENNNSAMIDKVASNVAKYAKPETSEDVQLAAALIPAMMNDPEKFKDLMTMMAAFSDN